MPNRVFLHPKANDFLKKLPKTEGERIKKKLRELEEDAERGKPLKHSNFWSLRIGDYRAIYEIKGKKVVVLFMGHRKDVYDDFSKLI